LVRNNVFKVITIFGHSRVGKTTTEVAFEFPSVVLEPNFRDPNFRVADIRTDWPTSRPLPAATDSLYGIFTKSSCPLHVFGGMLSKESVYREQCVTNVGVLHKPADSVPLSMQEVTQEDPSKGKQQSPEKPTS